MKTVKLSHFTFTSLQHYRIMNNVGKHLHVLLYYPSYSYSSFLATPTPAFIPTPTSEVAWVG